MLLTAVNLRKSEQYNEGEDLLKQIVLDYPESTEAVAALWELAKTYIKAQSKGAEDQLDNDLVSFLIQVTELHAPGQKDAQDALYRVSLKLMVGSHMRNGDFDKAIDACSRIITECPKSSYEEEALYDLFTIYFELLRDEDAAKKVYADLLQKYPNSSFIVHVQNSLGTEEKKMQAVLSGIESSSDQPLPANFSLRANYPNPFNPQTTITYALPQASYVKIEIYNILGQKTITLVDEQLPAGYHTVRWSGRNEIGERVGAGIYLCRMQAGEFVKTQKMTLLP